MLQSSPSDKPTKPLVTPDPVELKRRLDADKLLAALEARVLGLLDRQKVKYAAALELCKPLRIQNGNYTNERLRLAKLIRINDGKMRTLKDRALHVGPELKLAKQKVTGRKKTLKDQYVRELLCRVRIAYNKNLPLGTTATQSNTP